MHICHSSPVCLLVAMDSLYVYLWSANLSEVPVTYVWFMYLSRYYCVSEAFKELQQTLFNYFVLITGVKTCAHLCACDVVDRRPFTWQKNVTEMLNITHLSSLASRHKVGAKSKGPIPKSAVLWHFYKYSTLYIAATRAMHRVYNVLLCHWLDRQTH